MTFVDDYPRAASIVRRNFTVAIVALAVGGLLGLVQALHRTGVYRGIISSTDYYSVLTAHGVLLALVFTTSGIVGLFTWAVTRSFGRDLPRPRLTKLWVGMLVGGATLAAIPILGGLLPVVPWEADVLFTFYAPLQAHPAFYVGAATLIVGSWLAGVDWFLQFRDWRADNPDSRIPLQAFMVLTTMIMWYVSTLGVAVEVVVFLIPWSLGLLSQVDPLLTRTLFWYFGHPVVYFWLMPAYLVWYTVLPKLAGGRLLSDGLARIVFVLFVLLSTPVGFHHQYVDPGIAEGFKFIAMTNTMFLLLPSLLTAFTVVASLEHGARQNGGRGLLKWLRSLPWTDPAFSGCALAGLLFAAGGFSGMINAGMNINYLVHNTLWVPGHFHLTVGTAFALTFMAVSYWLVPQITGKRLRARRVAMLQPFAWFVGMVLMSNAMHRAGLSGLPRRTAEPEFNVATGVSFPEVIGGISEMRTQIALGAVLLTVALLMYVYVMFATWATPADDEALSINSSLPDPLSGPEHNPRVLDNLALWTVIALALVAIAYGPPLAAMLGDGILAPGSDAVEVFVGLLP